MRLLLLLSLLVILSPFSFASAPSGIPRELARERAALISDLHYRLQFTLVAHASSTSGHADISFQLKSAAAPLLIDYREGTASNLQINGSAVPVVAENGHIVLPQEKLRAGENKLSIDFVSPVAPAGKAITRFEDKDDGNEYIYTLFVPMDASMAFPCFDQPDLKGRFSLNVTAPAGWTVISNTDSAGVGTTSFGQPVDLAFAETKPISTYLFAFAAGPFKEANHTAGLPGVWVRSSQYQRAIAEAPELQEITARGMKFLEKYFAQPFPFPKYDLVLIPGFAYGGMEHAGATFLREHEYDNATWEDLVRAFERASGRSLEEWASAWIKRRGMPQVDVAWNCSAGKLRNFKLSQHDVLNEGGVWPIAMQVLLSYNDAPPARLRVELTRATENVPEADGRPCPAFVFANDHDYAYGRFLLDRESRRSVENHLGSIDDLFERSLLWGSLWDSVREAQLAPWDYLSLVRHFVPAENDESLAQSLAAHTVTALHRYVHPQTRAEFVSSLESIAADRMQHAQEQGLRIVWFRAYRAVAETVGGRERLQDLLDGKLQVPGVQLRSLDRWRMVTALIALNDAHADQIFAAERQRDHTGDGLKYAYVAEAARPDSATKKKYFDDYLHNATRPEDWVEQSLGAFNYWNESELTLPYLRPALEALPQIKRERKIFFVLGWLGAFIDGQQSAEADNEVHQWLNTATVDPDLRLKVLEFVDDLDRAVKIKKVFP